LNYVLARRKCTYRLYIFDRLCIYTTKIAALENFDDNVDMNRAWENIIENKNFSQREPRSLRVTAA
jgi:hypothetical protein